MKKSTRKELHMSFSLQKYQSEKQQLNSQLSQLTFVLKELELQQEITKVHNMKEQLANDQFLLAVVGEFSRGKSTFINALLGKKLLPSSAKPTTTILNTIRYSEEPFIELLFHDEKKPNKTISEQEFAKLVAPKEPIPGDPDSQQEYEQAVEYLQSIKLADIGHPLSFSKEGVTIIDTPGTNDLDAAREQITNNLIPKSDAVILLLSAVKLLSDSEMSFLRDRILASDIQKVFIAINFKDDLKTAEDEEKVRKDAITKLQPLLPGVKLYFVTAKHALNAKRKANGEELKSVRGRPIPVWDIEDTGFLELEAAVADFLQYERGAVKLGKPIKRTQKLISAVIKKQLQFQKNALTQSIDNLHEKVAQFRGQLGQIRKTGKEALKTLDYELSKEGDRLKSWYSSELGSISAAGLNAFDSNRHHKNADELPGLVESTIAPLERDLHLEKTEKVELALQRSIEKASITLNEEWAKFDRQFQQTFNSNTGVIGATSINVPSVESSGIIFFEDLLDELGNSWAGSTTLLGKVFSGAGIALTVVAYGIVEIGRSFVSWLFGEDKTAKLRQEVSSRLQSSKQNKTTNFKKEWNELVKAVKQQYETMVDQEIAKKEQQMQLLIDKTDLKENELKEKLHWISQRERKLLQVYQTLTALEKELSNTKEKVEV